MTTRAKTRSELGLGKVLRMDSWYYKLFGDEFGPVTFDELVELAKSQVLASDDEVRLGESGAWRRAGSMGQLMAHMPSGAHLPSGTGSSSGHSITIPTESKSFSGTTSGTSSSKTVEAAGWYYQLFGELFGPISFEDMVELAKNQTISADDDVRFGENGAWRRAGSIGQLMAHLPFQAKKNAFSVEIAKPAVVETPVDDFELGENVVLKQTPPAPKARPERVAPPEPANVEEPVPAEPEVDPAKQVRWWCKIQDKEYGPVELSKLVDWAVAGRLLRTDYVRFGLDPYILADKLPGLFPELPKAADTETKREFNTTSRTQVMAATSSVAPASTPAYQPPPSPTPDPTPAPRTDWNAGATQKPTTNWQTNTAGAGFNRPAMPMGKPAAKSSSGSFDFEKIKVPLLGGVGAIALIALLYFAIPYLPLGDSADVKMFKRLNAVVLQLQNARSSEVPLKKEELQSVASKIADSLKPIEKDLKTMKTPATAKLKGLAKALGEVSKEELSPKPSDAEKGLGKKIADLAKMLKLK